MITPQLDEHTTLQENDHSIQQSLYSPINAPIGEATISHSHNTCAGENQTDTEDKNALATPTQQIASTNRKIQAKPDNHGMHM